MVEIVEAGVLPKVLFRRSVVRHSGVFFAVELPEFFADAVYGDTCPPLAPALRDALEARRGVLSWTPVPTVLSGGNNPKVAAAIV